MIIMFKLYYEQTKSLVGVCRMAEKQIVALSSALPGIL